MLNRTHAELIRWCGERGTGVVSYGPLGFGLLTGAITTDTVFAEGDWRGGEEAEPDPDDPDDVNLFDAHTLPETLALVGRMSAVADGLGVPLAQLALAWNRHQPGVTSAIAGSRDPGHVRSNAAAGDVRLAPETLRELDALLGEKRSGGG